MVVVGLSEDTIKTCRINVQKNTKSKLWLIDYDVRKVYGRRESREGHDDP